MLTFLRKVRKSLIGSGSTRRYILYAIGEIALVVIGILIALQINTWNNERILRQKEKVYLSEIRGNLLDDLETTRSILDFNSNKLSIIDASLRALQSNSSNLEVGEFLRTNMPVLSEFTVFTQNKVAFNNMLSAESIDIITDETLRTLLSTYYRDHNLDDGTQERLKELTRKFVDYVTPLLMTKENVELYLNIESNFPSGSRINYKSNTTLFGNLFGMQRNMESHSIYIEKFQKEIELLFGHIDNFLNPS